jgi:hypothetical protein
MADNQQLRRDERAHRAFKAGDATTKCAHVLVQCVQFKPTLEKCWNILVAFIRIKLQENSDINKYSKAGAILKWTATKIGHFDWHNPTGGQKNVQLS